MCGGELPLGCAERLTPPVGGGIWGCMDGGTWLQKRGLGRVVKSRLS